MNTVITIDQLTHCFEKIIAVDQLCLEFHAGEIFGLLSHNSAGKTTNKTISSPGCHLPGNAGLAIKVAWYAPKSVGAARSESSGWQAGRLASHGGNASYAAGPGSWLGLTQELFCARPSPGKPDFRRVILYFYALLSIEGYPKGRL
jgi:hypothetical protein